MHHLLLDKKMIEIISQPTNRKRKEFTCFKCGCVYQADFWDYEFWNPNYEWGYRLACPVCKDDTWHKCDINGNAKGVKDVSES
jgi:hypothetical protein